MGNNSKSKKFQKEFGIIIRKRRRKIGLSQERFAELADIHRTYVSSIELGKVDAGLCIAYKIATALNRPLNSLIKEAEKNL